MRVKIEFKVNGIVYNVVKDFDTEQLVRDFCCDVVTGRFEFVEFTSTSSDSKCRYIVMGHEMLKRGTVSYKVIWE